MWPGCAGNKVIIDTHKDHMTTLPNGILPTWACWLAQDADGTWWAFEVEPNQSHQGWYENELGRYVKVADDTPNPQWYSSLIPVNPKDLA